MQKSRVTAYQVSDTGNVGITTSLPFPVKSEAHPGHPVGTRFHPTSRLIARK